MNAETLLEYNRIDLPEISPSYAEDREKLEDLIRHMISGIQNEPVEIFGQAPPLFIAMLFLRLKDVATEIIYRRNEDEEATVLFTLLADEEIIRPHNVSQPMFWSEQEFDAFDKAQEEDSEKDLELDIEKIWKDVGEDVRAFLTNIYSHSSEKDVVTLTSSAPVVPFLFSVNWFSLSAGPLFVNKFQLK